MTSRVLVFGGSGVQGGAILDLLHASGWSATGVTRQGRASKSAAGAALRVADLGDQAAVHAAMDDQDIVVFLLPLVFDAATAQHYTRTMLAAAEGCGVSRLVAVSSGAIPDMAPSVLSFEMRRHVEDLILASSIPSIVLRPGIYMENLSAPWSVATIDARGVLAYPLAGDVPVSWITVQDVARLVGSALDHPAVTGEVISVGGPQPLTGVEAAAVLSAHLGREVRYAAVPPDDFERGLVPMLGAGPAAVVAGAFHWFAHSDTDVLTVDMGPVLARLPASLTPFDQWCTSQTWHPAM